MEETKENLGELSDQLDEHLSKIHGPITIARNNFVSKLDYSDNFEVSFEFKASVVPTNWQQILTGSLTSLFFHALNFPGFNELINQFSKLRQPVLIPICCSVFTITYTIILDRSR